MWLTSQQTAHFGMRGHGKINLGYSKENCKWATVTEQARNRRATKLDEDKVVQIKILLETGVSQNKIASQFFVSRSNIGHIAQGTTWRQL